MEMTQLLEIATSAAQEAGDLIKTYYHSAYKTWDKSPNNPVTSADLAANRLLRERLMAATPECGWLSEETVDTRERLDKHCTWVVDPLDGTKEFIAGQDEFAVSVAYVDDGRPRLGVIHNPATGETIAGIVGQGLTYNGGRGRGISGRTQVNGARVLVSDSEVGRGMWAPYQDILHLEQMGSTAYKLGRVAAGFGDAYVTLKFKSEWDICAGVALVLAVGGQATDLNGQPLHFNQADVEVAGVVAANPALHAGLVELLGRTGKS